MLKSASLQIKTKEDAASDEFYENSYYDSEVSYDTEEEQENAD